jgi:hypothetical protein
MAGSQSSDAKADKSRCDNASAFLLARLVCDHGVIGRQTAQWLAFAVLLPCKTF